MNDSLPINLCIIQPPGSVPVQGMALLDAAIYWRHQFLRLGAPVTLSKNRLVRDAVNMIFGAHLGFDASLKRDYTCMFVNLEPLTASPVAPLAYLDLMRHSLVVDHDPQNVPAYTQWPQDVPLVSFGHAPYVPATPSSPAALAARPIDLLFIGTLNERRARMIARIEAMGRKVTTLATPLYGPERDRLVAQARGVLMCHPQAGMRLDPVQAFQVLSAGTPVVAERSSGTPADEALDLCTLWFDELQLERFFADEYGTPLYFDVASKALEVFRQADPIEAYADCLAFAMGVRKVELARRRGTTPRALRRLHIGAGCDYKAGWLNVDADGQAAPDIVLDLAARQTWPLDIASPLAGPSRLAPDAFDEVQAGPVIVQAPNLHTLMDNCLTLLRTGGRMSVTVPHERSTAAWQDPRTVRAMNEQSWRCWTDRFWTQGWFTHRFERTGFLYLDHRRLPCERDAAWFMQVELTKVETTLAERAQARHQRADFGPLYLPDADQLAPALGAGDADSVALPAHGLQAEPATLGNP